jgi:hypothetical protein
MCCCLSPSLPPFASSRTGRPCFGIREIRDGVHRTVIEREMAGIAGSELQPIYPMDSAAELNSVR